MTKYYFYSTKDTGLDIVWDLKNYVENNFDPNKTKFIGVMIEADTILKAHLIYNKPTCGHYSICDEPQETASLRIEGQLIKSLAKDTSALKLMEAMVVLYSYMVRVSEEIKTQYSVQEDLPTIFESLKKNVITELQKYKYGKTK